MKKLKTLKSFKKGDSVDADGIGLDDLSGKLCFKISVFNFSIFLTQFCKKNIF